ncbi:MAG: hypothetical protein HWE39_08565 [Oceanospirillaceae bacterium]|nr:hypothetical protein [Oceanospirillaceae bacterium]
MFHWLIVLLAVLWVTQVQARWADEFVHIDEPQTEDVYIAGRDVEVFADAEQDIVAAGQRVSINGQVGGDVIAAGETVLLRGDIVDDVRVAGRSVTLFGQIGDHLVAAGQRVSVERGAEVGGRAWLAGETVQVDGRIGRALKAMGRKVTLGGEVNGDANITGEEIRIEAGAIVHGDLVWSGKHEPEISAEAQIAGEVVQKPLPEYLVEPPELHGGVRSILGILGPCVAGVVIYLLFPQASLATASAAQASPWKSLGLGFLVLVVTPVAMGLLFVTVVGYVLALMLLALYLVTLALGALAGFFAVGDLGLRLLGKAEIPSRSLRVLSIIAAIVIVAAIQFIPLLGGFIGFLVWLLGLGAVALSLYRAYPRKSVV